MLSTVYVIQPEERAGAHVLSRAIMRSEGVICEAGIEILCAETRSISVGGISPTSNGEF